MKSLLARATVRPNGIVTDGVYVTDLPNTALVHVYAYRNKAKLKETKVQNSSRLQVYAEMQILRIRSSQAGSHLTEFCYLFDSILCLFSFILLVNLLIA